jgi:transketolase
MGRHKIPQILKKDGSIFYNENYTYYYGKTDIIKKGDRITVVTIGAVAHEVLKAYENFENKNSLEVIVASSIKKFDEILFNSIRKTRKVVTIEDHNPNTGLGQNLAAEITKLKIKTEEFYTLGPKHYFLSGKVEELYEAAGIGQNSLLKFFKEII